MRSRKSVTIPASRGLWFCSAVDIKNSLPEHCLPGQGGIQTQENQQNATGCSSEAAFVNTSVTNFQIAGRVELPGGTGPGYFVPPPIARSCCTFAASEVPDPAMGGAGDLFCANSCAGSKSLASAPGWNLPSVR